MANDTQFDLKEALRRWRENLRNNGSVRTEDIAELETHVTDTVRDLGVHALSNEEAFLIATRRVGSVQALKEEFGKVNPEAAWHSRAIWMIVGILFFTAAMSLAQVSAQLVYIAGSAWPLGGLALGWIGLGAKCALLITLFLVVRGLFLHRGGEWLSRALRKPVATALVLIVVAAALQTANVLAPAMIVRAAPLAKLGQIYAIDQWGTMAISVLVTVFFILTIVRLAVGANDKVRAFAPLLICLLTSGLLGGMGCGQKSQPAVAKPEANATGATPSAGQTPLEQSMALWTAGDKDAAIQKFLAIDFLKGRLFSGGAILSYSEPQFAALPAATRESVSPKMLADISALKALCVGVRDLGKEAAAKGDQARAAKCVFQLKQCGEALEQPSSLGIAKMLGKALKKVAAE